MATLYIDAAARPNPKTAAGAAVFKIDGRTVKYSTFLGPLDNHEAEWATLLFSVKKARELNIDSLIVYTDSKVISDSFDRNYVKNSKFRPFFDKIQREVKDFNLFLISHTPRKMNKGADALAKETLHAQKKK